MNKKLIKSILLIILVLVITAIITVKLCYLLDIYYLNIQAQEFKETCLNYGFQFEENTLFTPFFCYKIEQGVIKKYYDYDCIKDKCYLVEK